MDIGTLIIYLVAALTGSAIAGFVVFVLFREQSGTERGIAALIGAVALGIVTMSVAMLFVPPPVQAGPVAAVDTPSVTPTTAPVQPTQSPSDTPVPATASSVPTAAMVEETETPVAPSDQTPGAEATQIQPPPLRPTDSDSDPSASRTVDEEIQILFEMVNYARIELGLAPFAYNDDLATAANTHSEWMAQTGIFDHTGEAGSTPADRATAAGYEWIAVSENIYMGEGRFDSAEAAFDGWWYSPGHHVNMVSPKYREAGIGIVRNADGEAYYTMMHGASANVLPVFINGGDETTTDPEVKVYLSNEATLPEGAPQITGHATEVRLSNSQDFVGATWIPWARTVSWTLTGGAGTKQVWVEYRDEKGRTTTATDTIELVN